MNTTFENARWPDVKFGPAISSGGLTVFPIMEEEATEVDYLLLEDAIKEKVARVTEVSEQGSVPVLEVENLHERPLLVLQGEELVGAKQDRTLNVTILLAPGRTQVPVTCVEVGRWGYQRRELSSGSFEHQRLRRLKAEMVSRSRRRKTAEPLDKYAADQLGVWDEVAAESGRHAVRSSTGKLGDVYDSSRVKASLDEIEKGIELPANTRGAAVGIDGELEGIELLESARVFRRVWPRLLRSYALGSVARHRSKDKTEKKASKEAAETLLAAPGTGTASVEDSIGLGQDVRWETPDALATALFHEGRMVHGTIFRRDPAAERAHPVGE